ncbi:peptide chain release factor 1 [Candidatus Margulisiibacteriota bacterium]
MILEKRYQEIEKKYKEIEKNLGNPDIIADQEKYQELSKLYAELKEHHDVFEQYKNLKKDINEAEKIINEEKDKELIEFANHELLDKKEQMTKLEEEMKILLIPKDPHDASNIFLEVRSGTGGSEAALFAADIFRMYSRYAEKKGWKVEIVSINESELGGLKEVIAYISGENGYGRLKFEGGVHRVQRVPVTEASGRIHTSAASVAVMSEVESSEIEINQKDLRIDTFRASGAGGQHVNKTDSAVRITHNPTGIVVACQDGRSQHQNKDKAMKILMARLYEAEEEKRMKKESAARKKMVGTGDRSEKIRTYNFPQSRVTDHRINFTVHNLEAILDGDLDEIIDAIIVADKMKKLESL